MSRASVDLALDVQSEIEHGMHTELQDVRRHWYPLLISLSGGGPAVTLLAASQICRHPGSTAVDQCFWKFNSFLVVSVPYLKDFLAALGALDDIDALPMTRSNSYTDLFGNPREARPLIESQV